MGKRPPMTPQERIRMAQFLRKAANNPRLPGALKAKARLAASNLVKLNMIEATRKKPN